jgi:hypothetical protein
LVDAGPVQGLGSGIVACPFRGGCCVVDLDLDLDLGLADDKLISIK